MTDWKKIEIINYTRRKKTDTADNWGRWEQPVTIQVRFNILKSYPREGKLRDLLAIRPKITELLTY